MDEAEPFFYLRGVLGRVAGVEWTVKNESGGSVRG